MRQSTRQAITVLSILYLSFLLVSCASIDQSLQLTPIPFDFPISASSALYIDGQVIQQTDYELLKDFQFEKIVAVRIKAKTVDLDLVHELTKFIKDAGGNAIVKLKVEIRNIDTNNLSWIALERYTGALALLVGIEEIVMASMLDYGTGFTGAMYGVAGAGAALIGGSFLHEKYGSIVYSINISGTVVSY